MKKIKQSPHAHTLTTPLSPSYKYSPLYYSSQRKTPDSKSQTSVSTSNKAKNSNKNLQIHPVSDNKHIVDLYDDITNNGDITIVDDSDLQLLVLYARESKRRATLQKNFDQADNFEDQISLIKGEITNRSKNLQGRLNNQRTDYENEDIKNMNEEMISIQEQELQEFDNNTSQLINDAIENQQCEQNSFETNWESSMPIKYRKPSAKLLQMKYIEKSAILTGDIPKARQIQVEIEQQTQKEANEQIKKYNSDYNKMKKRLIIKQQQEMDRIKQNRKEMRQIIVTKHELDKEVYEKRLNVINNKDMSVKQINTSHSESGTDVYGCSLSHIIQETNFEIDPLLPELPSQSNNDTRSSLNSYSYNLPNNGNCYRKSRPSSSASMKRGSSVQGGYNNIGKFKWILAPSNDPKYKTKTADSSPKQKRKDNFRFVKKPNFSKFEYLFTSKNEISKENDQAQSFQQNENTQKNNPNSPTKENGKFEDLDTNEVKFAFDAE